MNDFTTDPNRPLYFADLRRIPDGRRISAHHARHLKPVLMLKQGPERWTVLEPFNGTLYPDINDSRNWDPRTGWTDVTMLALTDGTGTARTLTLTALQDALAAWEARNFAPVNPLHRALGVAEEAGELCHAVLKRDQGIRGTHEGHTAKIRDAIGDIAIFCMQICSAEGLRAEDVFAVHPSATAYYLDTQEALRSWSIMNDKDETLPHDIVRYALCLAAFAGSLCDTFSSRAPRSDTTVLPAQVLRDAIQGIIGYGMQICTHEGWNFDEVLRDTACVVLAREWRKP